jgi:hypothetical protein
VDSGDVLSLFAGIAIVIAIAVIANPHYLSGLHISQDGIVKPAETVVIAQISVIVTPLAEEQDTTLPPILPKPDAPPYRIFFTEKPFTYPVYKLPENLLTTGASETPRQTKEWVPFAFIENTRGGLTQVFSVPYPIWVINTTVVAENQPQYANFRMALCFADTGGIIKGEEIVNRGSSYRLVRTANTSMYMIIGVNNIDWYHISLETPREYYKAYSS